MKNTGLIRRAAFSLAGWRKAISSERSLRAHVVTSLAILAVMIWRQPDPFWWAVMLLAIGTGWGFELLNAALERLCDHLHPQQHEAIGEVKDMASASAFTVNVTIAVLLVGMIALAG